MTVLDDIAAAIERNDVDALEGAVDNVCTSIGDHALTDIDALCAVLKNGRRFTSLGRIADAALQHGHNGRMWSHLVQSLLDGGAYIAAEATIAKGLRAEGLEPSERPVLAGHAGRIGKDLYLRTGVDEHLTRAIDAYATGVREGGDPLWLGVNAHALAHLARTRGVSFAPLDIESEHDLMRRAEVAAQSGDPWAVATMIETSLLIGLPVPVDTIVSRLADATPFLHGTLRRQLRQVWGLPDDHPAMVTLAEMTLRQGGSDEIELPSSPSGFEKMFGTEAPIPLDNYRAGLTAAGSVCSLTIPGGFHAGTGFVLAGEHVHPSLGGRRVVVTNEHVVPHPTRDGVRAQALSATFSARDGAPIDGFTGVWWSVREDLDIALLVSDKLDQSNVASLTPARMAPEVYDGAYVYVVGHPGGGGLQMSIRGNDLLDCNEVRMHYMAPTKGGSSGSPVFDQAWQLVGVHHYSSANLAGLKHKSGHYSGNQGTALGAVQRRLAIDGLDQELAAHG